MFLKLFGLNIPCYQFTGDGWIYIWKNLMREQKTFCKTVNGLVLVRPRQGFGIQRRHLFSWDEDKISAVVWISAQVCNRWSLSQRTLSCYWWGHSIPFPGVMIQEPLLIGKINTYCCCLYLFAKCYETELGKSLLSWSEVVNDQGEWCNQGSGRQHAY